MTRPGTSPDSPSLRFLGTGTGVPYSRRAGPGVLVANVPSGRATMLDCGPDAPHRAAAAGFPLDRIDRILVTHFHTDHNAGLVRVLFALRNPSYAARPRPLEIVGPVGLRRLVEGFRESWGDWVRWDPRTVAIREVTEGPFDLGDVRVEAIHVEHTPQSLAYRLAIPGAGVVAYSGDTGVCDAASRVGREADVFVLECSVPEEDPPRENEHLTPTGAGSVASGARSRLTVLTHFYPAVDRVDVSARVRARYDGPIRIAEDDLEIPLGSRSESLA